MKSISPFAFARRRFLGQAAGVAAASLGAARAFAADNVIRIGYISPRTGPFSPFSEADDFIIGQLKKSLAGGLSIGNKRYSVEIIARDDQTSSDRASNLAAELINKENIDLLLCNSAVGPGAPQQCELNDVPCISTMTPWQAWLFPMKGDPAKGFKNAFHFFWGIEDIANVFLDIWSGLNTNKVLGTAFENTVPGNAMGDATVGMPAQFTKAGYKLVDVGRYSLGADDFSAHIQAFKKADVEIITGLFNPPEWSTFMKQSIQMGFRPKIATIAKAFLFPSGVAALGSRADGMSTEIWWTPSYPFRSSITGQSSRQLAESYSTSSKKEWTQPLGVNHALFEAGIGALKASGDPKNPKAVTQALRTLKLDTVIGTLDFAGSGIKNVSKIRVVGGQWRLNAQGKPEIFITHNRTAPEITIERRFESLRWA